jgi:hypothetical protein
LTFRFFWLIYYSLETIEKRGVFSRNMMKVPLRPADKNIGVPELNPISPNRDARSRIERFLAPAPKKIYLIVALVVGLSFLILAAKKATPQQGLNGRYYANDTWTGAPVWNSLDPVIRFQKSEIVEKVKDPNRSSIVWEGFVFVPWNAKYKFTVSSDDGSWVFLDDKPLIDNGGIHPLRTMEMETDLSRGNHRLLIRYFDGGGDGSIDFRWTGPGALRVLSPSLPLYPKPVSPGVFALNVALPFIKFLLVAAFCIAGVILLNFLSKKRDVFSHNMMKVPLRPVDKNTGVPELNPISPNRDARSRIERFLSPAPKKVYLFVALVVGLSFLILAAEKATPQQGLNGRYYANDTWTGAPVWNALDPVIRFQKSEIVEKVKNPSRSSIVWEGFVFVPRNAKYKFTVSSDDGSWVFLDDKPLIDNGGIHPLRTMEMETDLSRGNHRLLIRYFDGGGDGSIDFRWTGPGALRVLSPSLPLYPKPVSPGVFALNVALPFIKFLLVAAFCIAGVILLNFLSKLVTKAAAPFYSKYADGEREILSRIPKKVLFTLPLLLFLVLVGIYQAHILANRSDTVKGTDSYAYLQGADLMARNGFLRTEYIDPLIPRIYQSFAEKPPDDKLTFLLSPHGYYVYDLKKGSVYNLFPPGVSILLYPFVKLGGRASAFYVLPFLNILLIFLFFYWGSKRVDMFFGLCLSAVAMFNTQVFENTVLLMSDVPSMALLALSAYGLAKNIKARRLYWPFMAGACFGFSLLVRYSNVTGVFPLAYLFWLKFRTERRWGKFFNDAASFGAGVFLFGLLPLGLYTQRLLGTVFRLVYEPLTQSQMLLKNVGPGMVFYLKSIGQTFGILGAALMVVGLGVCLARPKDRAIGLTCLIAVTSFIAFYAVQSIRHERYLVPAYPFLAALYAFGVLAVAKKFDKSLVAKFLIVAFCAGYPLFYSKDRYIMGIFHQETTCLSVRDNVAPNAVVFCDDLSGPIRLYTEIPSYRLIWTNRPTLQRTIAILIEKKYVVYFLLDSAPAEDWFSHLTSEGVIKKESVELVTQIHGFPLYRCRAN